MNFPYNNRFVFSNYYLNSFIPELTPEENAFEEIKRIYNTIENIEALNEAQLEQHIVEPVLKILGWNYIRQAQSNIQGTHKVPDYALYIDNIQYNDELLQNATALLEVKKASVNLDNATSRNNSPHFQLIYYLTWLKPKYGILTNGKLWRLYVKGLNKGPKTYYEIDIYKALENQENFKYFYHIFKKEAFIPQETEQNTIDEIITKSELYARELENDLRKIIYSEWLEFLGQFFYENLPNESPQTIYNLTLLFLFRLLFIAYAEAREILPVRTRSYFQRSLYKLIQIQNYNSKDTDLFEKLKKLFAIIDKGSPVLGVPAYNGGLFSSKEGFSPIFNKEKELLHNIQIPNDILKKALYLVFVRDNEIIDFSTLDTKK